MVTNLLFIIGDENISININRGADLDRNLLFYLKQYSNNKGVEVKYSMKNKCTYFYVFKR